MKKEDKYYPLLKLFFKTLLLWFGKNLNQFIFIYFCPTRIYPCPKSDNKYFQLEKSYKKNQSSKLKLTVVNFIPLSLIFLDFMSTLPYCFKKELISLETES